MFNPRTWLLIYILVSYPAAGIGPVFWCTQWFYITLLHNVIELWFVWDALDPGTTHPAVPLSIGTLAVAAATFVPGVSRLIFSVMAFIGDCGTLLIAIFVLSQRIHRGPVQTRRSVWNAEVSICLYLIAHSGSVFLSATTLILPTAGGDFMLPFMACWYVSMVLVPWILWPILTLSPTDTVFLDMRVTDTSGKFITCIGIIAYYLVIVFCRHSTLPVENCHTSDLIWNANVYLVPGLSAAMMVWPLYIYTVLRKD
jgi:hypothetical protein